MTTLTNHLNETTEFLKEKGVQQADFGLILGSGLGELANEITDAIAIPFNSRWTCWTISLRNAFWKKSFGDARTFSLL